MDVIAMQPIQGEGMVTRKDVDKAKNENNDKIKDNEKYKGKDKRLYKD